MASILIPLANGCEELEAVTLIDLFRRAGFQVITAGLEPGPVRCSRGTTILPDQTLDEARDGRYDLMVLPGGQPGADHLNADPRIHALLKKLAAEGRYVGAICAAPKVLADAGLLKGKLATAFPGVLEAMDLGSDTKLTAAAVQRDGNVITSKGPGTAMDFALDLIELLAGPDKRRQVEAPLQRP
ncbi:DJ-1 family glyoxalase III [Thioalkalivibrio sulfidiphilus]|uniref:DJ-1 family protein n=1 Tax=Thioalkalivibrio sulfidiphilus (strain HL-EbGR7) TaxID=396588 RepID=B8GRA3_THISH|nr:DJ-1 family glyoxalase III [Thioalkalivibrio sulfidiphilus]ACL74357.1 DJ-1 family protein [Thioalkalivibrio sulfidiphilus HL-EbGr7]